MTTAVAVAIAGALAGGGWIAGWLTPGGALLAAAVGTAVLSGAGVAGFVLLGVFFVSGSLLSAGSRDGSRRRAAQVLANGWTAAAGGLLIPLQPGIGWAVLVGGLAASQADTWATETGRRWGGTPRLVTSGRQVVPGTSGGVTWAGTVGAMAGAVTIAGLAWALGAPAALAAAATVAGTAGMLADSVLGATVQARYRCAACGQETETALHCPGGGAHLQRGWRWMTNDTVNAIGSAVGAACTLLAAGR